MDLQLKLNHASPCQNTNPTRKRGLNTRCERSPRLCVGLVSEFTLRIVVCLTLLLPFGIGSVGAADDNEKLVWKAGVAAVDVYEDEPVLDARHPLLALPNVLCTPHLGYVERDNYELYFGTAFDNLLAFAAGRPTNLVEPTVVPRA